jgi:molybdate transport system ATP-binding protein
LGRALLAGPRALLLDEPLASLDAHRKEEVLRYLELMREEIKIPVVYVSHAVEEVVRLADTVVLMSAGRVVAVGNVEEVMGRPDLRPAVGVFEGGTVIDTRVAAQDMDDDLATLAFDGGTLTVTNVDALIGEPVRVRIRARDVSIALDAPSRISIQNVLQAKVVSLGAPVSGVVDVSLVVGGTALRSRVTKRAASQLALAPGREVYALIKAVSLDRSGSR